MAKQNLYNGWNRIAAGLDVEVQHSIPVRVACNRTGQQLNEQHIINKIYELTGLTVSVKSWLDVTSDERESELCIDSKEFDGVLSRLALSSAAIYVDRFHRSLDSGTTEWTDQLYSFDFNQAVEHCCIPYKTIDKRDYYEHYVEILRGETERLVSEQISPLVENEQIYS